MRPEKMKYIEKDVPAMFAGSDNSDNLKVSAHNSCHDLHTEWFKSDEFKSKIEDIIYRLNPIRDTEYTTVSLSDEECIVIASAISKYLGGNVDQRQRRNDLG